MLIDWNNLPPEHNNRSGRLDINLLNILRGRRPENMPSPVWTGITPWRRLCIISAAITLLSCGTCVAIMLGLLDGPFFQPHPERASNGFLVIAMSGSLFTSFATEIGIRRYLRRVDRCDGELCLTCGYHLHGLPTEHRCPECGTEYNLDETRETWRKVILSNVKPPRRRATKI